MAGMFNAAMASVSNAAARLGDTVSPPQKPTKGPTTTYDNASKDIMTKINRDMEAALQSKAITKRDTLLLRSLQKHYRTQINRRDDYMNLAGFCIFGFLYLTVLIYQRTSNEAYGVTSVLETIVPATKIMSTRDEVFSWLEETVTKVWTDPDCGDGVCDAPIEFPGYDRFGCSADCGSVLEAYKNISGLHVDFYYDFSNQPGALSSVEGLSTVSWNLCPSPGTAAGKKGLGGVPHGTECFFAKDQRLTAIAGKDHIVLPEVADGEWELRIAGDLLWKVAAAVRYHAVAVPETLRGKMLLANQAALSALAAEKVRLDTSLVELGKAGDVSVISIEFIRRAAATEVAFIDVQEKTNAYNSKFAATQRIIVGVNEAVAITKAQQGVANCVNRFVSTECGVHFNQTDLALAEHFALQRRFAKLIAGQAQLDALTALTSFRVQLFQKAPELADELDHMVINPAKYVLTGATEETRRQVRTSIDTLMEIEVERIQSGVLTKLTSAVVDATDNAGLVPLITRRRDEVATILEATPAQGLDAFTELSALGRFGGGVRGYKLCNIDARGAGGYAGTCTLVAPEAYDAERCENVCQCGELDARALGLGCNATAGEMCVCDKCQGTIAMGNIAGAAAAAAGRRRLLQNPTADERTLEQLSALQTSNAALEASLAAVRAAQAKSIASELEHHGSTVLTDSIARGFTSVTESMDSLSTIIQGVAPSAAQVTLRATEIEARVGRLASLGTDRLALLAASLTVNIANIVAAFAAGYATAESRDTMVRKTQLKVMTDEMETYMSSQPCAVVSRRMPFSLTSGGRSATINGQRLRTVGLTNRVIGGIVVYITRAGEETCDTRFHTLQTACLDQTVDNVNPYGVDPAFKRGSSFYSPDMDKAEAARLYNCSRDFGAAATYDAATGNAAPFCTQLFDTNQVPYGFFTADTKRFRNGYPVFLDINLSKDNAARWLRYLRESFLLEDRTKLVHVNLVTYNAEIRYFGSMSVDFSFDPAGSILVSKDVAAVRVEVYSSYTDVVRGVFEGVLSLAVVASLIFEMSDLRRAKRTKGAYMAYFESGWNYVDLASIGITFSAICYWWTFVNVVIADLNVEPRYDVYQDLEAPANLLQLSSGGLGLVQAVNEIGDVAAAARSLSFYITLMSINIVLYVARILKFMNFQPRIGLVTRTLAIAASDLVHFFILAAVVFMGYAIMGHLLFGSQIEAFSTLREAMQTNFEMLLGEVTISDQMLNLKGASIEFASVMYFWSYQIFVFMILLNFLLAIIVDAFSEVKATLNKEKSMYEEITHIFSERYTALGAKTWARGSKEYVTEDRVETQLHKWAKASAAVEDEEEEVVEEEVVSQKTFKLGNEEITKEDLEEVLARAVHYSQGKFNLWNVKGDADTDPDTMKNPALLNTGRFAQALKKQKRPMPTQADVSEAADLIMENAGEIQVDALYDDEVTKVELSKALNDVKAGQNRLAQTHREVLELLGSRAHRGSGVLESRRAGSFSKLGTSSTGFKPNSPRS